MDIISRLRKGSLQLMENRLNRTLHPISRTTCYALTMVYTYIFLTYPIRHATGEAKTEGLTKTLM